MPSNIVNIKYCEFCLKNAHEKIEMKVEKVFDENWENFLLVCSACGSTKKIC